MTKRQRLYLCAAGNCHEERPAGEMVMVRETDGSQHRFCSRQHAAEWLVRWQIRYAPLPFPPSDWDAPELLRELATLIEGTKERPV